MATMRPSDCKFYCGIHCIKDKHNGKECPSAHFGFCSDFTAKDCALKCSNDNCINKLMMAKQEGVYMDCQCQFISYPPQCPDFTPKNRERWEIEKL